MSKNTCDIVATEMQLLGSRQGSGAPSGNNGDEGGGYSRPAAAPRQTAATPAQRPAATKPAASGFDDMDDDIRFKMLECFPSNKICSPL